MTLGSLFDGSGGFPLAGALNGIKPLWSSEVEPYPIAVTRSRFPNTKHYGNVCYVNGAKVEPVDIITFGSPCQDMSVAGKRAGLDGARSNLFYEAIRIIEEMRKATNGKYPKYAVWENVAGAFSSNKGHDFHAVLEAFCAICDSTVSIPEPIDPKQPDKLVWNGAGEIVGSGYSVAWRTFDAQYWRVPQRRRRIYAVADFNSERAGEILFKWHGLRGDMPQGYEAREGAAADAVGGVDGGIGGECVSFTNRGFVNNGITETLRADCHAAQPCIAYSFDSLSSNSMKSSNPISGCNAVEIAKCIDTTYPDPSKNQGGIAIVQRSCYGADCRNLALNEELSGTIQAKENGGQSLNYVNPVVYDARRNGDGEIVNTLAGDHQCRITDYTAVACFQNTGQGYWNESDVGATVRTPCGGDSTKANLVVQDAYAIGNGQANQPLITPQAGALNCMHDQQAVIQDTLCFNDTQITSPTNGNNPQWNDPCHAIAATDRPPCVIGRTKQPRRYIIRRLMPIECGRLQGFPDGWADLKPYDGDAEFWEQVRKTHAEINSKKYKPVKDVKKWYDKLHNDGAEYKMWGNGIALPNAEYVIRGIAVADAIKEVHIN